MRSALPALCVLSACALVHQADGAADGPARHDAGASFDAGRSHDAGAATPRDAGRPGSLDASVVADAGLTRDAGTDAGHSLDAGMSPDAGRARDAGHSPDAGSAEDAGISPGCIGIPDDPSVTRFDPAEVYAIVATLGGSSEQILLPLDASHGAAGLIRFQPIARGIRSIDGAFVYTGGLADVGVRIFALQPDAFYLSRCSWVEETPGDFRKNDPQLTGDFCTDVLGFTTDPYSNDVLYRCRDCALGGPCEDGLYRNGMLDIPEDQRPHPPYWFGGERRFVHANSTRSPTLALTIAGSEVSLHISDETAARIEGLTSVLAARVEGDGFRVLVRAPDTDRGAFFHLAWNGTLTYVGALPAPLEGSEVDYRTCVLDGRGRAACTLRSTFNTVRGIVTVGPDDDAYVLALEDTPETLWDVSLNTRLVTGTTPIVAP